MDVDKFPKSFETGCRSIIKGHSPTMNLHPIKFLCPEIRFLNEKMQSSLPIAKWQIQIESMLVRSQFYSVVRWRSQKLTGYECIRYGGRTKQNGM